MSTTPTGSRRRGRSRERATKRSRSLPRTAQVFKLLPRTLSYAPAVARSPRSPRSRSQRRARSASRSRSRSRSRNRRRTRAGKPPVFEKIQGVYFVRALQEARIAFRHPVTINRARATQKNGKMSYPLLFPRSLVEGCRRAWVSHPRPVRYAFRGYKSERRSWVSEYQRPEFERSDIFFTNKGRTLATQSDPFVYDWAYYRSLASATFALCPPGEHDWTYRFFEAVMCGAIPVVNSNCIHECMRGFRVYAHDAPDTHKPSASMVAHNIRLFLAKHTL